MTEQLLIVSGTLVLTYGLFLGIPMAASRMKSSKAPRHLVAAHLEALIAGPALLGSSVAAGFSRLPETIELAAACAFTAGVALSLAGGTLNWLAGADDAFAERPKGWYLQASSGPLMIVGGLVFSAGVVMALW